MFSLEVGNMVGKMGLHLTDFSLIFYFCSSSDLIFALDLRRNALKNAFLGRIEFDPALWTGESVAEAVDDMGFHARLKRVESSFCSIFVCLFFECLSLALLLPFRFVFALFIFVEQSLCCFW